MTLELPELLEIEWDNYADRINDIYDIYLNEIYGKLSFFWKTCPLSYCSYIR